MMRALFTLEAAVLGLFGSLLGLPLGWAVAHRAISGVTEAVSAIYIQVSPSALKVSWVEVTLGLTMGVLGSMFAAFWPAHQASKVHPIEALRRDASSGAAAVREPFQLILGAGLLVASLILMRLPPPIENFPLWGYLSIFCALMAATSVTPVIIMHSQLLLSGPATALGGISGRLGTDNFARAPARSAVPVAALSIGVAMAVALGGFIGSFKESSQRWLREGVPSDLFVTSSYKIGGTRSVPMEPAIGEDIAKIAGVTEVDRIRLMHHDFSGLNIFILSLNPELYLRRAHPQFIEGDMEESKKLAMVPNEVTISENLLNRRNLHRGDFIEVDTPTGRHKYRIHAVIVDYTSDQGVIFMSRDQFIKDFKDDRVDTFEVYVDDATQREGIRKEITERWGAKYNLYVMTNDELRAESTKIIDQTFQVTYAMEFVAVVLALLGVINTLLAAVIDRTREIGLLRAVGATQSQVIRAIAAEAACIGVVGSGIGIITGMLLSSVLIHTVGAQGTGWNIPLLFPWVVCAQMAVASIACAVLAGLYPARRAARLDVVEALAWE
jgi:putative ABC transport system permease protein